MPSLQTYLKFAKLQKTKLILNLSEQTCLSICIDFLLFLLNCIWHANLYELVNTLIHYQ